VHAWKRELQRTRAHTHTHTHTISRTHSPSYHIHSHLNRLVSSSHTHTLKHVNCVQHVAPIYICFKCVLTCPGCEGGCECGEGERVCVSVCVCESKWVCVCVFACVHLLADASLLVVCGGSGGHKVRDMVDVMMKGTQCSKVHLCV